jgi:hypothetical protein
MTSNRKLKLDVTAAQFYKLIKKWYNTNDQKDLDICILYFLDNYDDVCNDGDMLTILRHILTKCDFNTAVDCIFVGLDAPKNNDENQSCRLDGGCDD